jgi:hypothetical protein
MRTGLRPGSCAQSAHRNGNSYGKPGHTKQIVTTAFGVEGTKQTTGGFMTAPQQGRPGPPPDPDQQAEVDEIQDLEAPADAQQEIAGGQDPSKMTLVCK